MKKSTERFTETVQDYVNYRPSYPKGVRQTLVEECGLTKDKIIADIGSGTGLLSKLFLDYGNVVYGVEPNEAMRSAGEKYLESYENFHSINATAEAATIQNHSVDFITVGTAFHWFDIEKTKLEFKRILKSTGWVLLVWNIRDNDQSALLQDYENLINKYMPGYHRVNAKRFDQTVLENFFAPQIMEVKSYKNSQQFDWQGFKGRLFSSSYSLRPSDKGYSEMLDNLKTIFDRHQKNGVIDFLYNTKLYYGQLNMS